MKYFLLFIFALSITVSSCSSTKELSGESSENDEPLFPVDENIAEEFVRSELDDFERTLYDNRSYMSVHFSQIEQEIPDQFLEEIVREEREIDEFAGFRVQILSTREVAEADSTTDQFRTWTSQELPEYQIETYVVFRQPYYRVRVGNFKIRENAIEFSRMLKNRYPDAWVVHDRIDPENITKEINDDQESPELGGDNNGSNSLK
jgi:hypothetical protein